MDRVMDAVAQLVGAFRSLGVRPPVAIVLESENEVCALETGARQIWEHLLAAAPASKAGLPQPTRMWGVQF
jgi:hypothetical protein